MSSSFRTVWVVGGGPAGLAAAIALRRTGCAVTVVDCGAPPIDKACGEGLMPDSLAALRELGIGIPHDVGFAFRGVRFSDARSSVWADFPSERARGVRRTILHSLLIERATEAGAGMIWNAKHVRMVGGRLSIGGNLVDADLIVGADGLNSTIRRAAGLNEIKSEKRRYAFRRHYRTEPWSPYMELHWGPNAQVYVTPIAANEICVAAMSRDRRFRLEDALSAAPEIKARLKNASPISPETGALSVSRSLRSVCRDNVVLTGDASGSVDAITGEGMCLAFKQALALEDAVRNGGMRLYQQRHRALMRRPAAMACLMLGLERNPRLQRRALASLALHPEIFQSLLAIHVGAASLGRLWSPRLLGFGRAFLAA